MYSEELLKRAESGDAKAQNDLGLCYINGDGVTQDYKQAVVWLTKSADHKFAEAQWVLGLCYHYGDGIAKDYTQSVYWFSKAAEQGHAKAQYTLGLCYHSGEGVTQDYQKSVDWKTKAAEQGYAVAQYDLGLYHAIGKKSITQLRKSGPGTPDIEPQAVYWFTKAAEQGYADAQHILGSYYRTGSGVKSDYKQAVYWFTKAVEQGHAGAQYELGRSYFEGKGVEKDMWLAVQYLTLAVKNENKKDIAYIQAKILLDDAMHLYEAIKEENMSHRTEVFISYSRKDSDILEELKISLDALKINYEGKISIWYDKRIETGQKWYDEIKLHMSIAKVAILLVSDHFLASEFIHHEELPKLLQAADDEEAVVIWVPLKISQVRDRIIRGRDDSKMRISDYQTPAGCSPDNTLRDMDLAKRRRVYNSICQDIKKAYGIFLD